MVELAPLTEADTALILAVSPFNTREYLSTAPVVTNITHMKRAATRTGQNVTDIYFNDARCDFITPIVAARLVEHFAGHEMTSEQYETLLSLRKKVDSFKISAQLLAGDIPAKAAHNQSNCVSLPFNRWRSLVDGHEEDKLELQERIRTMYSILQPLNISTTFYIRHSSLPETF